MPAEVRRVKSEQRSAGRLALRDAKETARQVAFLELDDVQEVEAVGQPPYQIAAEEVHDEAVRFVHVVAEARPHAEVWVGDGTHRVDLQAAGARSARSTSALSARSRGVGSAMQ